MSDHAPITARTWVAVFDGGRAAVFENVGFDDAPNLRRVFDAVHDNPPTRKSGSDRPGRTATPTGRRAAVEATDLHTQAEDRFVDELAERLDAAAKAGRFDRLVTIAPAKLIKRLHAKAGAAAAKIVAQRAGDFAGAPMSKIERAFKAALSSG